MKGVDAKRFEKGRKMGRVTIDGDEWDMGKEARYGIDIGYDEDDEEEMMEWDNEFMEGLDIGNITSDSDDDEEG